MANLDQAIVAQADGFSFTRAELLEAFNRVADRENWKQPIDAILPKPATEDLTEIRRQLNAIEQGVIFFAGCTARIDKLPMGGYRVRAAGYYMAVGA